MLLVAVSILVSGCALFTPRIEDPVITDNLGPQFGYSIASSLATTADRRIVLVRTRTSPDGVGKAGTFCAEPSPDAAENIASKVATAIEASVKTVKAEGEGKIDFARELATSFESLFHRTQGLQFYRDSLFNLCQGLLNATLTPEQYIDHLREVRALATKLIAEELQLTGGKVGGPRPGRRAVLSGAEDLDGAGDQPVRSDRTRALRLVDAFKEAKEKNQPAEAKVRLAQLHDLLHRNLNETDAAKRTLSDSALVAVLDRVRPLAKADQQTKLAVPADVKGLTRDQFEALFF
jgi:hypothetical protein